MTYCSTFWGEPELFLCCTLRSLNIQLASSKAIYAVRLLSSSSLQHTPKLVVDVSSLSVAERQHHCQRSKQG